MNAHNDTGNQKRLAFAVQAIAEPAVGHEASLIYDLLCAEERDSGPEAVGTIARALDMSEPAVIRGVAELVAMGWGIHVEVDLTDPSQRHPVIDGSPAWESLMAQRHRDEDVQTTS